MCIRDSCYSILASLPKLTVHSWLSALQVERFEQKACVISQRLERCNHHWEDVDVYKRQYVANSNGLLEFDGASWNLYPIRNAKARAIAHLADIKEIAYQQGFLQ